MGETAIGTDHRLADFIREHQVTYDVETHYEMHAHEKVPVGLELRLRSRPASKCAADPGCVGCQEIWEQLRELAEAVLPPGVEHDVDPFDAAFHLRPEVDFAPEVQLVMDVRHEGTFAPMGDAERRVVHEVEHRLAVLGAQNRVWDSRRHPS